MTTPQPPRWYCVNNISMATLCADQADAEKVANDCNIQWPRQGPHRAVQLVETSTLDTERTARIEAQQRLADMQELAAKAGLAHRMAVQRCVHAAVAEAVAAEREACAEIATDEDNIVDVPGYSAQLGDARATARKIEKAIRARGAP